MSNKVYKVLVIGSSILFTLSALVVGIILNENRLESKVTSSFEITFLSFKEDDSEVGKKESMEKMYGYQEKEGNDESPFREISGINVAHMVIGKDGKVAHVKTYGDLLTKLNIGGETVYERNYDFDGSVVKTKENLKGPANTEVSMDGKRINKSPVSVDKDYKLDFRYRNIGFVRKTDKETDDKKYLMVEQLSENKWAIRDLINKANDVKEYDLKTLRKDPVNVKVVNQSGAHTGAVGYKSQIIEGYPSYLFPIVFPFGTLIVSLFSLVYLIGKRRSLIK